MRLARHASGALPVWITVACVALLALIHPIRAWQVSPDSALYIGLAESLANGSGYVFNGVPETVAFPGTPVLLSAVVFLFGRDHAAMNVLMRVLVLASIPFVFATLRRLRPERAVLPALAAAGGVLVPVYLELEFMILSEPLYFLLSFAFLWALGSRRADTHRTLLLSSTLAMAAFSARAIGASLAVAWILSALARRLRDRSPEARRGLAYAVAAGVTVALAAGLWWLRAQRLGSESPGYETVILRHAAAWTPETGREWVEVAGIHSAWVFLAARVAPPLAGAVPGILAVIGWFLGVRRRAEVEHLYVPVYLAVLFVYPVFDARFLAPLAPLVIYHAFVGAEWIANRVGPRVSAVVLAGTSVLALTMAIVTWPGLQRIDAFTALWITISAILVAPLAIVIESAVRRRRAPSPNAVMFAIGMSFVAVQAAASTALVVRHRRLGEVTTAATLSDWHWDPFVRAAMWLRTHAPRGERALTQHPRVMHHLTGLIGRRPTLDTPADRERLVATLEGGGVRYLVIDEHCFHPGVAASLAELRAAHSDCFTLAYRTPGCDVWEWTGLRAGKASP